MQLLPLAPEVITWTREALEGLYDLGFLGRHVRAPCAEGLFPNGRNLHEMLQETIKELRPPMSVTAHSSAWRIYNVLNLHYAQGLSQSEAAAELNLSVRQFKREQERAVEAVAVLLFDQRSSQNERADGQGSAVTDTLLSPHHPIPQSPIAGPEPVQIDELLQIALNLMEQLLHYQDLHVTLHIPAALPAVRADRVVVRQLLISALSWLVHGIVNSDVNVSVDVERSHLSLRLQKSALSQTIVSPEAQGDLETVRQLANSCGALVRLSGASDSASDQSGVTALPILEITFPVSATRCVMLVEDNADAVDLVQRYLQQSGAFHAVAVMNPDEVVKQAVTLRPACIILDIMMPDRDGWELLISLKADPRTAMIPVIVSSVVKGHNLAYSLGAADVLPKPYSGAQLIATLQSVVAHSPQPRVERPA